MQKPLLLVTNDDGLDSPGLAAAARAALRVGDVVIAAPNEQQTAMEVLSRLTYGLPDRLAEQPGLYPQVAEMLSDNAAHEFACHEQYLLCS